MQSSLRRLLLACSCAVSLFVLQACGGDGDGGSSSSTSSTVTGSIVKGPVGGATVTIRNASTGAVLGTTTTDSTGAFTLTVAYTGDVIVEATGGSYTDEATSNPTSLTSTMRSVLALNGGTINGVVTPLTTLAYTYAFGSATSNVTSSTFNTSAGSVATQFQLSGTNLATTLPVVTGTTNAYGDVLRGISQYMHDQAVTLETVTNTAFTTSTEWTTFNAAFNAAFQAANPGSSITFAFDGNGLTVGGSGAGGGSGTCGIHVQGTVVANGYTVPLDLDYCVQGIAGGSCDSGNASLSQALTGQSGLVGAANLQYSYSSTCATGAFTITLL